MPRNTEESSDTYPLGPTSLQDSLKMKPRFKAQLVKGGVWGRRLALVLLGLWATDLKPGGREPLQST